jgi:hypothetical protein
MATLYEIKGQFRELMEMADECELTQADIADTLEGIEYEMEEKADAYAKVIRKLEGDTMVVDAEIKRLTDKKRCIQNNIKSLKHSLEKAMIETGMTKFKTPLFGFGIQKNPPSVKILDEGKIPEDYRIKQPDKIDKKAIIQALKESGSTDWAELIQTESLRIR